jgi:hypothetical protein
MKQLYILAAILVSVAGCSGRSDMRSVASQSSAILNNAQVQATKYAEAQTRYEAAVQANMASFSKMTAIGNQGLKDAQTAWIDQAMKSKYDGARPLAVSDYQKMVDDATAAPIAPTVITIDTSKVRQAVAKLNELAKEQTLESQLAFVIQFATAVVNAYQDAEKKAADMASKAATQVKEAGPTQR